MLSFDILIIIGDKYLWKATTWFKKAKSAIHLHLCSNDAFLYGVPIFVWAIACKHDVVVIIKVGTCICQQLFKSVSKFVAKQN